MTIEQQVKDAITANGEPVVKYAWQFTAQLLPFFAAILAEQELTESAKVLGLTDDQPFEAMKLLASLKKSAGSESAALKAHHAWVAAGIMTKYVDAATVTNIIASVQGKPQ